MQLLIGLGGNLGEVRTAFRAALTRIEAHPEMRVLEVSNLYQTAPVGPSQPDFLNAAALLELSCAPARLLRQCHAIEKSAGRIRRIDEPWGPRPLDLDLLMTPDIVCRGPDLILPHPRFHLRAFALKPAVDLVADWVHPFLGRSLDSLCREKRISTQRVERICDPEWKTFKPDGATRKTGADS